MLAVPSFGPPVTRAVDAPQCGHFRSPRGLPITLLTRNTFEQAGQVNAALLPYQSSVFSSAIGSSFLVGMLAAPFSLRKLSQDPVPLIAMGLHSCDLVFDRVRCVVPSIAPPRCTR
jgi:hypothetical protein